MRCAVAASLARRRTSSAYPSSGSLVDKPGRLLVPRFTALSPRANCGSSRPSPADISRKMTSITTRNLEHPSGRREQFADLAVDSDAKLLAIQDSEDEVEQSLWTSPPRENAAKEPPIDGVERLAEVDEQAHEWNVAGSTCGCNQLCQRYD